MKGLTERQQDVLDFIEEFGRRENMAPTVYEIATNFEIKPATAFAHLRALQRKGYVDRSSKARSLTLLRPSSPKHVSLNLSIPVLGRISAGMPLLAEENIEETIQLDPRVLPKGIGGHRLFGLRVNGQSMKDAGILNGDLIVAKEMHSPQIGDVVVALVGDEATVKHFYLNDGKLELRPANKDYKPQFYGLDEVQIQGIVIALYRTY
jgi:repressor LexA